MKKLLGRIDENRLFAISNLLFWLSLLLIFFVSGISSLDPDFSWHLRVGKDILENKAVPKIESYIFPTLGEHWVDHEWLSNLLLFFIYDLFGKFGYWFLGFSFAAVASYTIFLISQTVRKYFVQNLSRWDFFFLNTFFITLGTFALLRAYGIRLQVLTWLFFTLCFVFYFRLALEKKWKWLWGFPLLFLLWANLHGTFVLGLIIALSILGLLWLQTKETNRRKQIVLTGFATCLVTLITPYHLQLWKLIALEYTQSNSYLTQILEWLPLYAAPFIEWYSTFYLSIIIFIFITLLQFKQFPKKGGYLFYYGFVIFTMLLSIKARRFVPMFVLASFPFAIFAISSVIETKIIKKWFGFLVIFLSFFILFKNLVFIPTVPLDLLTQNTVASPYKAMSFIRENPQLSELRMFNKYGWGGYLVWMWPEKLHFIDGRMPQKPLKEKNNISLIEEYFKFRESEELAQKKLSEYQIDLVLLEKEVKIQDNFPPQEKFILEKVFSLNLAEFDQPDNLRDYLNKNWKKIYNDDISVVYLNPEIDMD